MYLAPHHFQVQARSFESAIHFWADSFWQFGHGFVDCSLDSDALNTGFVSVRHASGIMPDGLAFQIPESDAPPKRLVIADRFPSSVQYVDVYLAIPPYRENERNVEEREPVSGTRARFVKRDVEVADQVTGQDVRSIGVLAKNLSLAVKQELQGGDVSMPIARVRRDGTGHFVADPQYVPPCLQLAASKRLGEILTSLITAMQAKSESLASSRADRPVTEIRRNTEELANFWLLHTLNAALPPLLAFQRDPSAHPREVYLELARLGGALCTFALGSSPSGLPAYDHLDPGQTFVALADHIRRHLELVAPTNCVPVSLDRQYQFYHVGSIGDPRCFGDSRWVLGIAAKISQSQLSQLAPQRIKVSSAEYIRRVVQAQVPGAPLTALPGPPNGIPSRNRMQYFSIDTEHLYFRPVQTQRTIGIYVPAEFVEAEVELYILVS
jgi:type VI secretion system protein ImpJ